VNGLRAALAVLLVAVYPPGVLYWYWVHPFASAWRKVGAYRSLAILLVLLTISVLLGLSFRETLVGRDLGLAPVAAIAGLALHLSALVIEIRCRRLLKFRVLTGIPEMSAEGPGTLLTEGIYARVRHPRYIAVFLGTWGWALIANFSGAYIVVGIATLLLLGVVWLEERELRARFGAAWVEYSKSVPRFIPRVQSSH